jgi:hypothetical protein
LISVVGPIGLGKRRHLINDSHQFRSIEMRSKFTFSVMATASVLAIVGSMSSSSAREAIQDRYCLQGRSSGYPGNCQFSTYQQCMATASGTYETCGLNPMASFAQQPRNGYRRRY